MKKLLTALAIMSLAMPAQAQSYTPEKLATRVIERRAVEAVNWGMPAVNYDLMLQEVLNKTGGKVNQVVYWSRPLDWHNQTLTPNPDAIYFMAFFDTRDGPIALEIPAAAVGHSINANIVDLWQMPLEDAGLMGVDKGAGVKFAILPPGFDGNIPDGFTPLRPDTFGSYALIRSNLKSHADADVASSVDYGKQLKVYPLTQQATSAPTVFTDAANVLFDSTIKYDLSFFQSLDYIIQTEPWLGRDRAMIDILRSLGIEKGKPFNTDEKTKAALEAGLHEAQAWLEAKYGAGLPQFYNSGHWTTPGFPELVTAAANSFSEPDKYPVDARGLTYTYAYIGIKRLGAGQFYLVSIKDKDGEPPEGSKTYKLTVPPNAPVEQYWSVTPYDRQTHALIRNMDRASRSSQISELHKNADGSIDIFFGPKAPAGQEANWIPTDAERGFETMFRLYGPTKALFDKTWVLPDIEAIN